MPATQQWHDKDDLITTRDGRFMNNKLREVKSSHPIFNLFLMNSSNWFSRYSSLAALWNELQRDAVVAPALPGGRRAVVEDVAVVAAAADAVIFGARQN
jgi:hypothetical protein